MLYCIVLHCIVMCCVKNRLPDPKQVAGLEDADLQDMKGWSGLEASVRAFPRRTMWGVNAAVKQAASRDRGDQLQANSQVANCV